MDKRIGALFVVGSFLCVNAFAVEAWKDLNDRVLQLYRAGSTAEALPLAQQALDKAHTDFGDNSPEMALSLNNLALLYKTQGNYDEAIRLYERSLAIAKKIAGPDNDDLLVPLNNLAMVYEAKGQKDKADGIYQRIRAMGHAGTAESIKKRAHNEAN